MNLASDEKAKEAFRCAVQLREQGRHDEAIAVLRDLLAVYPDAPAILGSLGGVFYAAKRFEEAKGYFMRVLELRPNVELASLGLFHCHWVLGDKTAARAELVRFLRDNDSEEYAQLLKEMGWRYDRDHRVLHETRDD